MEIARGLALVHSLGRMHRDVKADNVLMTQDMHAKIADFGTASLVSMAMGAGPETTVDVDAQVVSRTGTVRNVTRGVGTPLWMAPEVLGGEAYDSRADVYSYGMVCTCVCC